MNALDPVALAQALIRRPSITPEDAGALAVAQAALEACGFRCERLRFQAPNTVPVDNLYARWGTASPNFCFAGHTDVVPPGDRALWRFDPFAGEIRDGILFGRGAADMKSAIAAFVAAADRFLREARERTGSITVILTGDEEGTAVNGTKAVLDWLAKRGERLNHCVVGEPTSATRAGDAIKIGRRGSMQVTLSVRGIQGHTAYPQKALNPIPILAELVTRLASESLDRGTSHFEPSTLAFSTFDVGNSATNMSPAEAHAACNLRFNDVHTPDSLRRRLETIAGDVAQEMGGHIEVQASVSASPFLTPPGPFIDLISDSVARVTNSRPALSTSGGTSDARFIKNHCPVAEIGLPGQTMHKADECMPLEEIRRLADIYVAVLESYFAAPPP